MKQSVIILICFCLLLSSTGCDHAKPAPISNPPAEPVFEKYQYQFYNAFDTIIIVTAYCETKAEFDAHAKAAEEEFLRLHKLFDRFNTYDGITNIKSLNDNAGKEPLKVAPEIMECLELSLDWYHRSGGKVNIALGAVTDIYQRYMQENRGLPPNITTFPDMGKLEEAAAHIDPDCIVLDKFASNVSITDPQVIIDLGATAKGFATEKVALLLEERGLRSYIISAGGNVRSGDRPIDGLRLAWGIGLENPDNELIPTESGLLDVFFGCNISVVSSGDYQRYYFYGDRRVHHLIDPDTLEPGTLYRSVIVISPDSGNCDALSTAVFLLDMDKGRALADTIGAELVWVMPDGQVIMTEGLIPSLMDRGGAKNMR